MARMCRSSRSAHWTTRVCRAPGTTRASSTCRCALRRPPRAVVAYRAFRLTSTSPRTSSRASMSRCVRYRLLSQILCNVHNRAHYTLTQPGLLNQNDKFNNQNTRRGPSLTWLMRVKPMDALWMWNLNCALQPLSLVIGQFFIHLLDEWTGLFLWAGEVRGTRARMQRVRLQCTQRKLRLRYRS